MAALRRAGWASGVAVSVVGLLLSLVGAIQTFPLIDFGTDHETTEKLHGKSVMEIGAALLLATAVSFALARCWGCTAAAATAVVCLAVLIAGAGGHRNLSVFALGLLATGAVGGVLVVRERPRAGRR